MSFILDALRKSETERQRQSGPGLVDAGYRPPARRRTIWLPLLFVVLLANLALLGVLWLKRAPGTATDAAAPAAPAPIAAAAEPVGPKPAATTTPPDSPEPAEESEFAAMAALPAEDGEPTPQVSGSQAAPSPAPMAGGKAEAASSVIREGLPNAQQLVASGLLSVPELHLDIHVFSTRPTERFVFINMRRYTEGAVLTEGPRIEEITREGVVLSQDGRRFVLTRD